MRFFCYHTGMNLFLRAMCVLSLSLFASGPLSAQSVRAFVPRNIKTSFKVQVPRTVKVPSFASVSAVQVIPMRPDVQKALASCVLTPGIKARLSAFHIKDLPGGVTEISLPKKSLLLTDTHAGTRAVAMVQKHKKLSKPQALAWLADHPQEAALIYGLPRFTGQAYVIRDLKTVQWRENPWEETAALRNTPYPAPRYAFDLLRGMRLSADGKDLRNIFKNGLDVNKAYDYQTAWPVLHFSQDPDFAVRFAMSEEKPISIMLHVGGLIPPHYRTQRLHIQEFTTPKSIPTKQIMQISAFLKVGKKPCWGQLDLLPSGNFLFRPYDISLTKDPSFVERDSHLYEVLPQDRIPHRAK